MVLRENGSELIQSAPAVSVIVPTYNGKRTIESTLRSIIVQDFRSLELIVVDDCSSDGTMEKVEKVLQGTRLKGRIVRHDKNLGLSASLNDGLAYASGDFVLILHQDCELVGSEWISKAVGSMNEKIAVITGYYGIPDDQEINSAKKAFGVLRRQIHAPPPVEFEQVSFSEGKCDLYRRKLLEKAGGFPTTYRIAGEDLSLSVRLRELGYSIVKCYSLQVVQRFTGKAETYAGNIQKEFEFGRAMGGVFGQHRLRMFNGIGNGYGRIRALHRASQVTFIATLFLIIILATLMRGFPLVSSILILVGGRYFYYVVSTFLVLRGVSGISRHLQFDALWIALLGFPSDFAYTLGFVWGMLRWAQGGGV